jgi:hypothetical protein
MTATDAGRDEELAAMFARLPGLVDADTERRGAFFSERFHVRIGAIPFDVTTERGRIVSVERGPFLLRSSTFAISASGDAWRRFWQPMPEPGFHDLFAMTKRGAATIEGNLQPFMANLQYVKDVLAAPRRLRAAP